MSAEHESANGSENFVARDLTAELTSAAPMEAAPEAVRQPVATAAEAVRQPEALEARRLATISAEARAKLEAWGADEAQIQRLQEITGRYDYDKGMEKTQDIAGRGGYLTRAPDGTEEVILPGYYEHASGTYGTCGDITARVIRDLHQEGWLEAVNNGRPEDDLGRIVPHLMTGHAREFFAHGEANHVWAGLGPAGASPRELLMADGSFGEVETLSESAYIPRFSTADPVGIEGYDTHGTASVTILTLDANNNISLPLGRVTALGISHDRQHAYNLGFARLGSAEGQISPYVDLRDSSGEGSSAPKCIVNDRGMPAWVGPTDSLSGITRIEVEVMVQTLSTLKLEENADAATAAINEKATLRFR